MEKYLKKYRNIKDSICVVDGYSIIAKDVDELNRRIYIVEKDGIRSVKLYNEIDQKKIPKNNIQEIDVMVIKKIPGGSEKMRFKNYDDKGNKIDIEQEIDKFLHPDKYLDKQEEII